MKTYQTIERSSWGAMYNNITAAWNVYEHITYSHNSLLSGQSHRVWMDVFDSEDDARQAYPTAIISGDTYHTKNLNNLPNQKSDDVDWLG